MNYQFSVFKDLLKSKDTPYLVDLTKIVNRIKLGKSKWLIDIIRSDIDKETRDKFKQQLPCILFAGEFTERRGNALVKASGLMCLDFDKYESQEAMLRHRELLEQNPHFVLVFTSPSGNGLKGVIRINEDVTKETFPRIFKSFKNDFDLDYWDGSSCNIDRVCFESYDPDIYVNDNAIIYNPNIVDTGYSNFEKVPLIPISDEEKIIEKIMIFDWKKDFRDGERNSFIFDLASAFCEYGITQNTADGYILNNVVIGEFTDLEARTTIKSAYKKRQFNSKYFEDYTKIDKVKLDLKKGKDAVIKKHGISEETFEEIKQVIEHEDFWFRNVDKKGNEKIGIDAYKYKLFLERNGFKKHYANDSQKPVWVKINSNKVSLSGVEKIKNENDIWNYCAKYQNLFTESFLTMLENIDLSMLNDTASSSYIAYNNGVLQIKKNECNLIDYIDIDFYIWENHILKRDFVFLDDYENEYKIFINNISSNNPFPFECTIGRLVSTYKNRSQNRAIILNDEVISDNPEGGTGKGIFIQGVSNIRKTCIIDGKKYDFKDKFAQQLVKIDDKILVFDDVKKGWDIESQFSLITEGITLEWKNKDAVKKNIHESPTLVLSTNYAIKGEGNSHDRRRHELEFSQYYGKNLTPADEFGRQLFDDWDESDFQRFDNYIVYCVQLFLKNGLVKQNAKNIKMRKLIAETSMEFNDWIKESVPSNTRNDKKIYFDSFINEYPDFKKWLTRKKFNIWIQKYCSFMDYEYLSGNSNGLQWFIIKNSEEEIINDEIDF